MDYITARERNEKQDRLKSALLTFAVALLIFLGLYFYTFTQQQEQPEQVTTMLLNFGDEFKGRPDTEPAPEDGSQSAETIVSENVSNPTTETLPSPTPEKKTPAAEKIISGNQPAAVPKADKTAAASKKKPTSTAKPTATKAKQSNSTTGSGDGRGTAAIGNLIRGRGNKTGSQGSQNTTGNPGDPLGGESNGDSRIGVDRKLVGFIPGTMGRGGAQPAHNCAASGTIAIAYTVDKAGNVVSARRSGGVSDGCIVNTTVGWVKKYVKAEAASTSSTGSYSITF